MTTDSCRLVVVDVETSGLDPARHSILELCAIDMTTGEELSAVPEPVIPYPAPRTVTRWQLAADPAALAVNRYHERGVGKRQLTAAATSEMWESLRAMLDGAMIGGVNPHFDAAFLGAALGRVHPLTRPSWSHRVRDLPTYAAGVLGRAPEWVAHLDDLCTELGVTNGEPHSAQGDARATADCFAALSRRDRTR